MRSFAFIAVFLLLLSARAFPDAAPTRTFDMYFIDVEGGLATLYVTPSGQSLLEDTGSPGDRDHDRILAALKAAGVTKLDYLVVTHYHVDHVGGVEALVKQVPVAHFIDHGPTIEPREQVANFQATYKTLYDQAAHTVVKPGDKISFAGVQTTVVASAGKVLKQPLSGAGQKNAACSESKPQEDTGKDPENAQSVGLLYQFGKFRTVNVADLTWNTELEMMCPNNPIGKVDLYLTANHGIDVAGSEALVHGLQPRVAIMNNGNRKGAAEQTYRILRSTPGLEDIWQLHWAWNGGLENNPPGLFIANVDEPTLAAQVITKTLPQAPGGRGRGGPGAHAGEAYWLKVSAQADGSFTITNTRNGFTKSYPTRQ